jgi:hypothetical protein
MRKLVIFFLVLATVSVVVASLIMFAISMRMEKKGVPPDIAEVGVSEADFVKIGNLTAAGIGWRLVYEEPGSPALTTALIFSDESRCGEDICEISSFEAGDRVSVEGLKTGEGNVLVVRLTYIN